MPTRSRLLWITATTTERDTTVYQSGPETTTIVKFVTVMNVGSAAVDVAIRLSGPAAALSVHVFKAAPPNTTVDWAGWVIVPPNYSVTVVSTQPTHTSGHGTQLPEPAAAALR